MKKRHEILT